MAHQMIGLDHKSLFLITLPTFNLQALGLGTLSLAIFLSKIEGRGNECNPLERDPMQGGHMRGEHRS